MTRDDHPQDEFAKGAVDGEFLALVFENIAEGVVVTDAAARILACNEGAQRILGLTREELLGLRTIDPGWRTIHEDGRPFLPEEYPAGLVLRDGKPRAGVIMGVFTPSGDLRWISINARPLIRAGAIAGGVATFIDITALRSTLESLRESEERHRLLVSSLGEGVVVLTRDGIITSCNEAAASMFGTTPEQVIGPMAHSLYRVFHEDGRPFEEKDLPGVLALQTGQRQQGIVMGVDVEGRPRRWVQVNAQPLTRSPEDGRPLTAVVSFADLTARIAAQEQRLRLEAQLLEAQKHEAISTLAGGIAHDFNNVLFAIQGNAEMARMELPPEHAAQQSLTETLHACERAKALVQRILAFSRRQETVRHPLALGPIAAETARLVRSALPPGVTIAQAIPPGLPAVIADEVEMQQVVLNLCSNAGHALKDAGGEIRLALAAVELDEAAARPAGLLPGPHVRLSVHDAGAGIDPAILPRIFDPFFTTKAVGEGTGLGLAVVRQIVDSCHGAISVRSAPGEGTTFEVLLPATNSHGARPDDPPASARGERVLFVDDEPLVLAVTARLLTHLGFAVTVAGSAEEALAALRAAAGGFDLVLSDLTMPRVTGLELAALVQREWPGLPVLLTTGNDGPIDLDEIRRAGVREVIPKPWTTSQLLEAFSRHLPVQQERPEGELR